MSKKASQPVERVEVKLVKPHKHRGKLHAAGATLSLKPRQVEHLRKHGKVA